MMKSDIHFGIKRLENQNHLSKVNHNAERCISNCLEKQDRKIWWEIKYWSDGPRGKEVISESKDGVGMRLKT